MSKLVYLSILLFFGGIVLFIISAVTGHGGMALFFIFPVFYSTGPLGALGMMLIFASIFLFFIAPFTNASYNAPHPPNNNIYPTSPDRETETRQEKHCGGVILIGPIPIVFGSSKNQALNAVIIAIVILMIIAAFILFMGI